MTWTSTHLVIQYIRVLSLELHHLCFSDSLFVFLVFFISQHYNRGLFHSCMNPQESDPFINTFKRSLVCKVKYDNKPMRLPLQNINYKAYLKWLLGNELYLSKPAVSYYTWIKISIFYNLEMHIIITYKQLFKILNIYWDNMILQSHSWQFYHTPYWMIHPK